MSERKIFSSINHTESESQLYGQSFDRQMSMTLIDGQVLSLDGDVHKDVKKGLCTR